MNTHQIANRLVELCRKGQYETAQTELYAENAVSVEPDGNPMSGKTEGLKGIIEKGHKFMSMVEEVHSGSVSDPIVVGDTFAVGLSMDATYKGRGRSVMDEICAYKVKDGKIVLEEFVY